MVCSGAMGDSRIQAMLQGALKRRGLEVGEPAEATVLDFLIRVLNDRGDVDLRDRFKFDVGYSGGRRHPRGTQYRHQPCSPMQCCVSLCMIPIIHVDISHN